jgi:peptidoglycan/LPS O-acetylase OafA/YrhL
MSALPRLRITAATILLVLATVAAAMVVLIVYGLTAEYGDGGLTAAPAALLPGILAGSAAALWPDARLRRLLVAGAAGLVVSP